jgi:uncharacterized membrane protein YdjX (TVP38/TMEM64 family)
MAKIMVDDGGSVLEVENLRATRREASGKVSGAALAAGRTNDGLLGEKGPKNPVPGERWIVGLLAAVGTLLLAYLLSPGLRSDLGGFATLLGTIDAAGVKDWLLSFGALSPIVYFLGMVAQVLLAPIPSAPVALAGSLVFGVWEGLALSLAGSILGSILVFLAARRWGEPLVARLVGREVYRKHIGRLDARGWWLFAVLLVPFMPDDAMVALAGLSALSFRGFLVVMVMGRIPGSTMTALLASEWVTGSAAAWISVGIVLTVVLALGFAYRERLESWVSRRVGGGRVSADPVEVPRAGGTR